MQTNKDLMTDIGLPPGQTRDGTYNTNNWTEAAFRTFDLVMLRGVSNKRYVASMSFTD